MITETTFFGLPLRTRVQRRLVVLAYSFLIALYLAVGRHFDHSLIGALLPMTITLGGLLGGIRSGGPIKSYEAPNTLNPDFTSTTSTYPIQTLNLAGIRSPSRLLPLDEREQTERDHAHYIAYRILRWAFGITALFFLFLLQENQTWLLVWSPVFLWSLVIVTLGLPQCIILWIEPDQPGAGDLTLISERN